MPLADVAVIICASRNAEFSSSALRRMAELNVLLMVCDEKFQPCALTVPYYCPTNTELLRRQVEWTPKWKEAMWRQVITAKIRNQAAVLGHLKRARLLLNGIADLCERGESPAYACESRAAKNYWQRLLPRLSETETKREPRTRAGVNGMLDYGYAIVRSTVLRSLAAHGFIAALGIHHADKAGSFALADDLMEPLRPWLDRELYQYLEKKRRDGKASSKSVEGMEVWIPVAAALLTLEVKMDNSNVRFLNAVDLYIQSFANASLARESKPLKIPML